VTTDERVEVLGRRVRLVDLSHALGPGPSEPVAPRVDRLDHADGAGAWAALYGIPAEALPGGLGFAGETLDRLSTHAGTHVDAPWHYAPVAGSERAPTIDEVPLSWCVGPLVVLDVSDVPAGGVVGLAEVDARLERVGHALRPGDVVALFTGAERGWGTEDFWRLGCGLDREAVLGLVDRGVRAIGTDAWSLDRPYPLIGEEWRERRDPAALWPAHFAGRERPYVQLEKLAHLEDVPPVGATVVAFPVKVQGGSGAWTRAVALVPDER
jgi:kynurenine formamidase